MPELSHGSTAWFAVSGNDLLTLGPSASSSYLTELVRGMTLEQAAKVKNTEIAKELVCFAPCQRPSRSND